MTYFLILLLALGIGVLHALIGGVKLVYSLPAYSLVGVAGIVAAAVPWSRAAGRANWACAGSTFLLVGYVVWRALTSPVEYFARHDLFMILGCLVVYLIALFHLPAHRHRMAFVWVLLAFALVHVGVGIVQFTGKSNYMPLPWMFRPDYGYRASGMYICPNHVAGYLEAASILGLSLAMWARIRPWLRIVSAYVAVMSLVGLALTGSRGGYLSIVVGLACFAGWCLYMVWKLRRRWFWGLLMAVIVGGGLVLGGAVALMKGSVDLERRLGQVYDTGNMRIFMWQAALKAYELNPATGTGSGTYLFWGRHFRSKLVQLDPQHVHCDYLELLSEYGIVGCIIFAIFLGTHLWSGFRSLKRVIRTRLRPHGEMRSTEVALILGIFGALGAIAAHSVVDFNLHIPGNALVFAFFFGILASNGIAGPAGSGSRGEKGGAEESAPPRPWVRLLAPVAGIAIIVPAVPDIEGEYHTERARVTHRDRQHLQAIEHARKALERDAANPNLYFYLGESKHSLALLSKDPEEQLRLHLEAVDAFNAGLKVFPHDLNLLIKLGRTYDNLNRFAEAERVFRFAIGSDPSLGTVYAYYGNHYFRMRYLKRAERLYSKALELGEQEIAPLGMRDVEEYRKKVADSELEGLYPVEDEPGDEDWWPEPL